MRVVSRARVLRVLLLAVVGFVGLVPEQASADTTAMTTPGRVYLEAQEPSHHSYRLRVVPTAENPQATDVALTRVRGNEMLWSAFGFVSRELPNFATRRSVVLAALLVPAAPAALTGLFAGTAVVAGALVAVKYYLDRSNSVTKQRAEWELQAEVYGGTKFVVNGADGNSMGCYYKRNSSLPPNTWIGCPMYPGPDGSLELAVSGGDGTDYVDATRVECCFTKTQIDGNGANDVVYASPTLKNSIRGGWGGDVLVGGAQDDDIWGGPGYQGAEEIVGNLLYAGALRNNVGLAADNDFIYGGAGRDLLSGGWANDYIDAGPGNDDRTANVSSGSFTPSVLRPLTLYAVQGGGGEDVILGGTGRDDLSGGPGRDLIVSKESDYAPPDEFDIVNCGPQLFDPAPTKTAFEAARHSPQDTVMDCNGTSTALYLPIPIEKAESYILGVLGNLYPWPWTKNPPPVTFLP